MSQNPLFEYVIWAYTTLKALNTDIVKDHIINAPIYYSAWWNDLYAHSPQHILIETGLIGFIIWLMFFKKTADPSKTTKKIKLTDKEVDWLVETWKPEPLVAGLSAKEEIILKDTLVVDKISDQYMTIRNVSCPVLNAASFDFLALSRASEVVVASREALDFYGCGSCGPRGFYGTIDKHFMLEKAIAEFMGTQEAILYSDSSSAVSSAIPAFAKKGDLLLVDEACDAPVLTGVNLSRATVQFFRHNDMSDLESKLEKIAKDDRRQKRDTTQQRRFIIVEGLYRNVGDICLLPEILRLKEKYFYRCILDESSSFGVLGKTGRGVTEHFGIDIKGVEIVLCALDTSLASVGGLCVGHRDLVDHQRLSGAGYCFSASAAPFLSAAALTSLDLLRQRPQLLASLHKNAETLYTGLAKIKQLRIKADTAFPIIHLMLAAPFVSTEHDATRLSDLVHYCLHNGVGITSSKFAIMSGNDYSNELMRPSLVVCASAAYTRSQMTKVISVITAGAKAVLR